MKTLTVREWGVMTPLDNPEGPVPRGKVRVRVKYAGVGRTDLTAVRGGYLLAPKRPFTPGYEYSGVDETGRRVAGMLPKMGAYQEIVDVDPRWCVPVPEGVDDALAAALPLNYLTALALLEKTTNLGAGAQVLVHGAGGGVGRALLELARLRGLKTYGLASKERADELRGLGAVPLDRRGAWTAEARSLVPDGFDAVFDAQGLASFRTSWSLLARGGVLAAYGFVPDLNGGLHHYFRGLAYLFSKALYPNGKHAAVCGLPAIIAGDLGWYADGMRRLFDLAQSGAIRPVIQGVFPWNEVEQAHTVITEGRIQGKLLLDFSVC
jgi:NADPH:quinone reductase-like Zn-dependent oxidoreductase